MGRKEGERERERERERDGSRLMVDQWGSLAPASPTGAFTFDSATGVYDIQARPARPPRPPRVRPAR